MSEDMVARLRRIAGTIPDYTLHIDIHLAADEIERLRALVTASPSPWRSMESAPKDGTRILCWFDDGKESGANVINWPEYMECFEEGNWWQPIVGPKQEGVASVSPSEASTPNPSPSEIRREALEEAAKVAEADPELTVGAGCYQTMISVRQDIGRRIRSLLPKGGEEVLRSDDGPAGRTVADRSAS